MYSKKLAGLGGMLWIGGALLSSSYSTAQETPNSSGRPGQTNSVEAAVNRMMAFDKNKDGQLTKDEVTDPRLQALFARADANKDGVVTKAELTALFTREAASQSRSAGGPDGRGGPGGFFPGGPGGPGGFGPGGPGGRGAGRMGGTTQPGQVLSAFTQNSLNLSASQKQQLAALQKEVDARLGKILTADQKKQLKSLRERGPGGPGRPDGMGGPGGPGGRNDAGPGGPGGPDGPGGPPDPPQP